MDFGTVYSKVHVMHDRTKGGARRKRANSYLPDIRANSYLPNIRAK